jgi:hypothetical protein
MLELLYVSDSKMASLSTRADIVTNKDYYLMPFMTGETGEQMDEWVKVGDGDQTAELIWDEDNLLGGGYEFE